MNKVISILKKICAVVVACAMICSVPAVSANATVTSAGNIAKGIDVSRYQGTIDWAKVANSGIKFAFVRIGNTFGGLDPTFEYNITQAQANGIKVGVYLYSYAKSDEEAAIEAQLTLAWLGAHGLQLPVVYDVEDKCHSAMTTEALYSMINTYCAIIDAAGFYPMVYTYKNFYHGKLGTSPWDKWMAQYGDSLNTNETVAFWQYSSSGSVPGISGRVDMDYQYKDYSNLIINEGFIEHNGATRFYRGYRMQYGWIDFNNQRYYADLFGNIQKSWFLDADGSMYFMDVATGAMQKGLVSISGFDFYFDQASGVQQFGFVDYGSGNKYFDPTMNGAMAKSWFAYNGEMHYAKSNGDQAIGITDIDGAKYFFDDNGALVMNQIVTVGKTQYQAGMDGILVEIPKIAPAAGEESNGIVNGIDISKISLATGLYYDDTSMQWINPYTGKVVDEKGAPIEGATADPVLIANLQMAMSMLTQAAGVAQ